MAGKRPTDADVRLGVRLCSARRAAGLTQRIVAAALSMSAAQLQKYEKGTNRISATDLAIVAELTGSPIAAFFDRPAAPPDASDLTFAEATDGLVTAALALAGARERTIAAQIRAEA